MPPTYAEYLEAQSQLEQQQPFVRLQEAKEKFLYDVKAGSYFDKCPRDATGHCKPKDTGDETGGGQASQQRQGGTQKPSGGQGQGQQPQQPKQPQQQSSQQKPYHSQGNGPKHPLTPQEAKLIKGTMNDFIDPKTAAANGFEQGYVTSKGSAYITKQGGTTRYKKSAGQGQGKIDAHSTGTYYVTPEQSEQIREIMQEYATNPSYKASVRSIGNDQIGIYVKDRKTGKVADNQSKVIRTTYDPKVGVSPVEIWDKDETGEYGFHIGHPIVKIIDFQPGAQKKALSYLDESMGGALIPPPAFGPKPPLRRNHTSVLDKAKLKELRSKYRLKNHLSTVEHAGKFLAEKWQQLEGHYGRREALMLATAMISSFPLPGNIAEIIAAAEVTRGVRTYFKKDLQEYISKGWITIGGGPCEGGEGQHCGGTRVFVDGSGKVTKGPPSLQGRQPRQGARPSGSIKPEARSVEEPNPVPKNPEAKPAVADRDLETLGSFFGISTSGLSKQQYTDRILLAAEAKLKQEGYSNEVIDRELSQALTEAQAEWDQANPQAKPLARSVQKPNPIPKTPEATPVTAEKKPLKKSEAVVKYDDNEREEITEKARSFGITDPSDLANLVGAPDNAQIKVYNDTANQGIFIDVEHPNYSATRFIARDTKGNLYIKNNTFFMNRGKTGTGLGTQVFSDQVAWAKEKGVAYIETDAGRSTRMNGYYTWARMGYDAPLDNVYGEVGSAAKQAFPEAKTVQDIMATPKGREWWKENGGSIDAAKFDLTDGSRSMRIHQAYLQERQERVKRQKNA